MVNKMFYHRDIEWASVLTAFDQKEAFFVNFKFISDDVVHSTAVIMCTRAYARTAKVVAAAGASQSKREHQVCTKILIS